jgi:hypothetical protein
MRLITLAKGPAKEAVKQLLLAGAWPRVTLLSVGKRKTRRWERRVRLFLIGVYGFKYAAWLPVVALDL